MSYSNTTIIIPTLNEAKSIGKLLDLITGKYPGINVIVADDGSRDCTQETVKSRSKKNKRILLLDRAGNPAKGLTASVIDAAKLATTEYIVVMDGDLQHPSEKIREIHEMLKKNDIVGAARKKVLVKWPLNRRLISAAATLLAKARLGRNVSDPLSGFFGIKTGIFKHILAKNEGRFEKNGYKVFFEILKYAPKSATFCEVNYDFGLRKGGESKINSGHMMAFLKSLFK
ncbi:glycosyltransferase [Candidatus Woesearchaeota archaeon]|nr:glycosyltransferase [Candidatus Woesearchaeota archaeon]